VATTIYSTLDTVVLGFLTDEFQVGLYTAAVKLSKVAIPLVVGLSAVMIPKMANSIESGDYSTQIGLLQKSFRFILFIATPISMGLFIFREQFILIFSGTDFLDAAQSMKYLAFLPLFIGLGYFFGFQILVPYGLNKGLFIATTGGLLFFGVLNVILTPSSGAKGTAISIFVAELMVTLFYVAFCPRKIILALSWKEMLRCIAIGLIFFPIYKLIQLLGVNPEIELVLGIIFCSGIYFSLHYYLFSSVFVLEGLQMAKSKLSLFKNRL